jgi:hypothetical protein
VAALAAEVVAWSSGDERSLPVIALAVTAILLGGWARSRRAGSRCATSR